MANDSFSLIPWEPLLVEEGSTAAFLLPSRSSFSLPKPNFPRFDPGFWKEVTGSIGMFVIRFLTCLQVEAKLRIAGGSFGTSDDSKNSCDDGF